MATYNPTDNGGIQLERTIVRGTTWSLALSYSIGGVKHTFTSPADTVTFKLWNTGDKETILETTAEFVAGDIRLTLTSVQTETLTDDKTYRWELIWTDVTGEDRPIIYDSPITVRRRGKEVEA